MLHIFDIDGTLADLTHRLHFIQDTPKDWPAFYAACVDDAPIADIISLSQDLRKLHHDIVLSTGRSDEIRVDTQVWLRKHGVKHSGIYMRKQGDHRQDAIVKAELLDEIIEDWVNPDIGGIFEDRKQCVDMYRAKGYRVFQVAEGDF